MKKNTLKRASMALLVAPLLFSNTVFAGPNQGVSCPSGSTTSYKNKKLKCYKNKTFKRASICPPINRPLNIVMDSRGSDTCSPVLTGNRVRSAMAIGPIGGPKDSHYRRVISQRGVDSFKARVKMYIHPRGAVYFHDAKKGVSCPSGYRADYNASSKRLKCKKSEIKIAACDFPMRIQHKTRKDICYIDSPIGRTTGNFTVPKGVSGVLGNPSNNGWRLLIDHSGTRDYWEKKRYQYRYPKGN